MVLYTTVEAIVAVVAGIRMHEKSGRCDLWQAG